LRQIAIRSADTTRPHSESAPTSRSRVRVAVGAQVRGLKPQCAVWWDSRLFIAWAWRHASRRLWPGPRR
jgi:hypothetical protein